MSSLIRVGIRSYAGAYYSQRRLYSSSEQNCRIKAVLEDVLEKRIFQQNVVWEEMGIFGLSVNLGEGIKADLFPGHEDENTTIRVTDGTNSVFREISEYWLENWTVAKRPTSKFYRED